MTVYKEFKGLVGMHGRTADKLPIGRARNGEIVTLDLNKDKVFHITGQTGSGKSCLLNLFFTMAVTNEMDVYALDSKNVEIPVYVKNMIDKGAKFKTNINVFTSAETCDCLWKLQKEIYTRLEEGYDKPIIFIWDEYQVIYNCDEFKCAKVMLETLVEKGKDVGVYFILATQSLNVDEPYFKHIKKTFEDVTAHLVLNVNAKLSMGLIGTSIASELDTHGYCYLAEYEENIRRVELPFITVEEVIEEIVVK